MLTAGRVLERCYPVSAACVKVSRDVTKPIGSIYPDDVIRRLNRQCKLHGLYVIIFSMHLQSARNSSHVFFQLYTWGRLVSGSIGLLRQLQQIIITLFACSLSYHLSLCVHHVCSMQAPMYVVTSLHYRWQDRACLHDVPSWWVPVATVSFASCVVHFHLSDCAQAMHFLMLAQGVLRPSMQPRSCMTRLS